MSASITRHSRPSLYATHTDRVDAQIRFNRDDDMTELAAWVEHRIGYDPLHDCAEVFRPSLDDECDRCQTTRATCVLILDDEQTRERVCVDCAVTA